MNVSFARAPHVGQPAAPTLNAPNAALLIDFDNVTMGIRSDITKELKNLFNSAIIKGKVAVQRAYADWRRYPQYVVPLAEASVDLIFAPAYGSSKKNATDIRLAIDALELVFTRPEIGVYILLSGDSDFSSLVLKLKEYGKYVIGVGIRESASDLLVQNCDEYYSYSALTGLTRAGEEGQPVSRDPWELVEAAVRQMANDGDVMRSDRLKQVLIDLDPNFDEKTLGFSKFNRFVAEAANRGVLRLQKMENGQFEIGLPGPGDGESAASASESRRSRGRGRRERGTASAEKEAESRKPEKEPGPAPAAAKAERETKSERETKPERAAKPERTAKPGRAGSDEEKLHASYDLLRKAATELGASAERAVRDSDVKRRILDLAPEWDESELGFGKFSRFLRQAHDAEAINLRKLENGSYEMTLPGPEDAEEVEAEPKPASRRRGRERRERKREKEKPLESAALAAEKQPDPAPVSTEKRPKGKPEATAVLPAEAAKKEPASVAKGVEPTREQDVKPRASGLTLGRRGSRGRLLSEPPPLLEGQLVGARPKVAPATQIEADLEGDKPGFDPAALGLPVEPAAVLAHIGSYHGIGPRSAETFANAVGAGNVFAVLHGDADRVREVLGARRGEKLLAAWREDEATRRSGAAAPAVTSEKKDEKKPTSEARARGRRGGRGRKAKKSPSDRTE